MQSRWLALGSLVLFATLAWRGSRPVTTPTAAMPGPELPTTITTVTKPPTRSPGPGRPGLRRPTPGVAPTHSTHRPDAPAPLPSAPTASNDRVVEPPSNPLSRHSDRLHLPPNLERLRDDLDRVTERFREEEALLIRSALEAMPSLGPSLIPSALEALDARRHAALAEQLGADELAEVELLNSDRAERLREEAQGIDLTDDEFRAVLALVPEGSDPGQRAAALRDLLGADRAQRLELNESPDYRFFAFLGSRFELRESRRDEAYAAHRELLLGRLSGQWNTEAFDGMRTALGDGPFQEYQDWLSRQTASQPGTTARPD